MNRRSFLKTIGLLGIVPFVPVSVIESLRHNPQLLYPVIYRPKATTWRGLLREMREKRRSGILSKNLNMKKPDTIILLKPHIYEKIKNEIPLRGRFMNINVLEDGFENFLVQRHSAIHGKYSSKTATWGKELVISQKKACEEADRRLNNAQR